MAEIEAQIEYKTAAGAFRVVLIAASESVFAEAAQQQDIVTKKGEALIAALVAFAKGGISSIERYKDGQRNDGANGEPAIEKFDSSGKHVHIRRWTAGKLNDGANGEPAVQDFSGGRPTVVVRYEDGVLLKTPSAQTFLDKLKLRKPEP